jgi:hypothetical protein
VIARIGPMLGMLPDLEHEAEIKQALYIPLQPARPAGAARTMVQAAPGKPAEAPKAAPAHGAAPLSPALPASLQPPPASPPRSPSRDLRHETLWVPPAPRGNPPAGVPQVAAR